MRQCSRARGCAPGCAHDPPLSAPARRCRDPGIYWAALPLAFRFGERRRALEMLFAKTAAAFGYPVPSAGTPTWGGARGRAARGVQGLRGRRAASSARRLRGRLAEYAFFTRDRAEEALQNGTDLDGLEGRLYRVGFAMGAHYRVVLRVHTPSGAMTAARIIYRFLRIDFTGFDDGAAIISSCSFARIYSARVCALVSAMDRGLLAGLSNGGQLRFHRRLTEGADSCGARLEGLPA